MTGKVARVEVGGGKVARVEVVVGEVVGVDVLAGTVVGVDVLAGTVVGVTTTRGIVTTGRVVVVSTFLVCVTGPNTVSSVVDNFRFRGEDMACQTSCQVDTTSD